MFSKDSRLYIQDWAKKKITQEIYLRQKLDMFCIEELGELENKVADDEYAVKQAVFHGRAPLIRQPDYSGHCHREKRNSHIRPSEEQGDQLPDQPF